jgi:hypothetical protein
MSSSRKYKTSSKMSYTMFNMNGASSQLNGPKILRGHNWTKNKSITHSAFSFLAKEVSLIYIWIRNLIQTLTGFREKKGYFNFSKI